MASSEASPEASPEASTQPSPTVGDVIVAAGGVVIDGDGPTGRVLVVHRPAYDDWSLPKGHLDAGEEPQDTALREVLEETGVRTHLIDRLGTTEHAVADGLKRVHWFLMRPDEGTPDPSRRTPDAEVDAAEWWPVTTATERLTYANERRLLAAVVGV
jgi:8-oxo-(d)GTP phosphatase